MFDILERGVGIRARSWRHATDVRFRREDIAREEIPVVVEGSDIWTAYRQLDFEQYLYIYDRAASVLSGSEVHPSPSVWPFEGASLRVKVQYKWLL